MKDPLHEAMSAAHDELAEHFAAATTAVREHDERRLAMGRTDTFLIHACQHSAAVCDVILPARADLPDGKARVAEYVRECRKLERAVAVTKGRLYGNTTNASVSWTQIWNGLGAEFGLMRELEERLVTDLATHLDADHRTELADRMESYEETAPTRPHPNSRHTGRFAHLSRAFWSRADKIWDSAEGRIGPALAKVTPTAS